MIKGLKAIIALLSILIFAGCAVDTKIMLSVMTDNRFRAMKSEGNNEYQASSYDRRSVAFDQPGWFTNRDASQYIRTEEVDGRKENVMLDVDGPGAVVRFWLTTFKRDGVIRIYFDNRAEPEITIPAYDLMKIGLPLGRALLQPHSSYEPKEKGGSTLYLPMPFAKHCKVTFEDKDPDNQPRYYQINYIKLGRAETFTKENFAGLMKKVDEANDKLLHPDSVITGPATGIDQVIAPNSEASVDLPAGSSSINMLSIRLKTDNPTDYAQALRSTVLKIDFDGEQTVWCPIGDFSGSGVGGKPLKSWYRAVTADGEMLCRWVMPYQHTAKITLLNLNDKTVRVSLKAQTKHWNWNKYTMYFHADWKNQVNVPLRQVDVPVYPTDKNYPMDWDLNTIEGSGVFVGETFAVYNRMHVWYGEGDQKLWVDGAKFPVEYGTGTEDYYNTSWAPVVLYQTPFANAPRADNADSFGYNTFTRTRNLDAVPFKKSFRFSLETLGWKDGFADFAATTYWYGFKGAKSSAAAHQTLPGKLPQ
ncbi:glycoside hydrolase family 172 protein [Mucilaginibacter ximonensis]|uniref:Glycoside hydrolase family 172 protein n=1 Tax=Mucilaginibacter ximonensis TaxID=538021 RepID=A0ABW5YG77_9SPHI